MTPPEIREARLSIGLTQKEFGALLHSTERAVRAWEAGDRKMTGATEELLKIKLEKLKMNSLFNILDGIVSDRENTEENLSSASAVMAYAENGCGVDISEAQAEKIMAVGKNWLHEIKNGNGEWSRMRHEAMAALEES